MPTLTPLIPDPSATPAAPTPTFSPDRITDYLTQEEVQFISTHEVKSGDTSRPVIMMTYDDNAKYVQVRAILDAFNKYDKKATFFFLGEKIRLSAKAVRAIVEEGHLLGCHGWEHISLLNLDDNQLRRSFSLCFDALNEVAPGYRMRFIRFPFGSGTNNRWLLRAAADWGMQHVYWTMGSGGLESTTYDSVIRNVTNGSIVLSHMFRPFDVKQTGDIVSSLIDQGYSLETIETGRKPEDIFPEASK